MTTFGRYLLFQLPAWTIVSAIALALDAWTSLSRSWIGAGLLVYVLKDFAIFPFVRGAYEASTHEPGVELVGMRGNVLIRLDPEGWVELRHERWRARSEVEGAPIEAGLAVEVRGLLGQVLLVGLAEERPVSPGPPVDSQR